MKRDFILDTALEITKEAHRKERLLEQELTLKLPEYLLKHLRNRARDSGCSLSFMIQRILIESFFARGLNVFKEKVDKRSAAYRKRRKPYQRNPRLLNSEKPRRKTYRRKNPDLESIGEEKPKRKGRPPKEKTDDKN